MCRGYISTTMDWGLMAKISANKIKTIIQKKEKEVGVKIGWEAGFCLSRICPFPPKNKKYNKCTLKTLIVFRYFDFCHIQWNSATDGKWRNSKYLNINKDVIKIWYYILNISQPVLWKTAKCICFFKHWSKSKRKTHFCHLQ